MGNLFPVPINLAAASTDELLILLLILCLKYYLNSSKNFVKFEISIGPICSMCRRFSPTPTTDAGKHCGVTGHT
jgi:hypothetical protein